MNVVHMSGAIGEARDWVEQGRANDIADLKARVVLAVSESGKFGDLKIVPGRRAELLRKDGMGDPDILEFVSAVGDADAYVAGLRQMVIEIGANSLYR